MSIEAVNGSLLKNQEAFTTAFTKVGGHVSFAQNEAEIAMEILRICKQEKFNKMMLWDHPGLIALAPLLAQDPAMQLVWNEKHLSKPELVEAMYDVKVGVTWTHFAVAETGSIVLVSEPGRSKSVSLLPDVHIAVLPLQQLYATRVEVFRLLTPLMKQHRAVTLISGPSKTGDIDGKLNVGVHGPKKVFVILINQEAGESNG